MTTDLALAALKSWIELRAAATYTVLSGIPILLRDTTTEQPGDDDESDEEDFDATFIVLNEASSEEHPVLRGVLTMAIEVMLVTADASDDLGKTDTQHRALNAALYNILADTAGIAYCNSYPGFRCWDIRGTAPTSETGDGVRTTTFALTMTGAAVG